MANQSTPRPPSGRVRYAVVGVGHIAQVAVLPAFQNARNAELTALVSDDAEKRATLSARYGVAHAFDYDEYDRALDLVDAVYIALPNALHAEYTTRAAEAGVHVLCEKPLAVTSEDAERMIASCREHDVKLMTAYRLHFERINLEVIDLVRRGVIGEPKVFSAVFSMALKEDDIRADRELGGGTVYDIGIYCINASRHVFGAEPKEVMAFALNGVPDQLPEIDEHTAAILRFEGERLATFVSSFTAADTSQYRIVGTKGDIHVEPAFEHREALKYWLTVDGKTKEVEGKVTDQFGPELEYFAQCIIDDEEPRPNGDEGLQDVRIIEAIYASADAGRAMPIPPYEPHRRPSLDQQITKPAVGEVDLVNTESPTK